MQNLSFTVLQCRTAGLQCGTTGLQCGTTGLQCETTVQGTGVDTVNSVNTPSAYKRRQEANSLVQVKI